MTYPNVEGIDRVAGDYLAELATAFPESENVVTASSVRRQREEGEGAPAKRAKKEINPEDVISVETMKTLGQQGRISKCTVPELKAFLGSVNVVGRGKKADLVEAVETYLSTLNWRNVTCIPPYNVCPV